MSQGSTPWGRPPGEDPVPPPPPSDGPSSAATPSRPGSGVIRPVPLPDGAASFEAIAMQSVLSRARDNSRFAAPATAEDTARRGHRPPTRVLIVVAIVIVALGIASGALWVSMFRGKGIDPNTVVVASETVGAKLRTPQETVRGYLTALEAGDIEKALTFGPLSGTGSQALLSPDSYAAMPESSRPRDISLGTDDPLATEIPVTYTMLGKTISTIIRVTRTDSGSYDLVRSTVSIQLQIVGGDNLPVFVNGVKVVHQSPLEVVPGTYTLTTGLPFVAFPEASSTLPIESLARPDLGIIVTTPELTTEGTSAFLEAARASLKRCIASTELTPAGCPNGISARKSVVSGSVRWTMPNASAVWNSFSPSLSAADQSVAVTTLPLNLKASMDYTDGSNSGFTDVKLTAVLSAKMLGTDPAAVTVIWGR